MKWPPPGWTVPYPHASWDAQRGDYWLTRWRDDDERPRYKLSRVVDGRCVEVIGVYPSGKEALQAHAERTRESKSRRGE